VKQKPVTNLNVTLKYVPRAAFAAFHARTQRYSVLVCHRRAGKTRAVAEDMVVRALKTRKKDAVYGYIAPTYGMAKRAAWKYIKEATKDIPGVKTSESETSVVLPNGSTIRCFGVDNPDNLRGMFFDGVVCDEFGEWVGRAYTEVIRPALSDRRGWAVFIGTPKGPVNKFAEIKNKAAADDGRRWFYMLLKASESGILPQEELDDNRIDMDPEEYEQEFECSFTASNRGSIYGKHVVALESRGAFKQLSVNESLYVPTEKVSLAMDIGRRDALAIWFWQVINGTVRFIDYFEETGMDAETCLDMLQLRPYDYEMWWLPHDARAERFEAKKSVITLFQDAGAPVRRVRDPDLGNRVFHGISETRRVMRTFPLEFDYARTSRGIDALRNYSRKFNKDDGVFDDKAKHDKWSNGADAFRYACLSISKDDLDTSIERALRRATNNLREKAVVGHSHVNTKTTFDEAWAEHQRDLQRSRNTGRTSV